MKFKENEHVRILLYSEKSINAYGRITMVDKKNKRYHVSNLNMPYAGTISGFFNEEDLRSIK